MKQIELDNAPFFQDWQPVFLNEIQAAIIQELLLGKEYIDIYDYTMADFVDKFNLSLDALVKSLIDTGLVSCDDNKLRLLTRLCRIAFLPSGDIVAGEDNSGRFSNWLSKHLNYKNR
jgi:hypothetical protein